MSFTTMGTYGPPNGIHIPQVGSRGYGDVNGSMSHQQYPMGQKPQIYTVSCLRPLSLDHVTIRLRQEAY